MDTGQAMSQQNVEVVRRIYGTWNQGSPTFYDLFDEQVELRLNVMMGPYFDAVASASLWPISWPTGRICP